MKLRKVMASVCCMGLVAGLAGCGGSKEAPATTAAVAAEADQKEESSDDAEKTNDSANAENGDTDSEGEDEQEGKAEGKGDGIPSAFSFEKRRFEEKEDAKGQITAECTGTFGI